MIHYSFTEKVVLVTGSSRGIGAEILSSFARAEARCYLLYWDDSEGSNRNDAEALISSLKNESPTMQIASVAADVRNPEDMNSVMQRIKAECGGLDILVNNAGIIRDRSLRKMTGEDWDAVISTNLSGVFHSCKAAVDILRDGGRIVNIASVAGLVGFHGQANYAAAKAGVIGMTRALSKELARRQITVNAVAPGVVQTPMLGEIKPEVMTEYLKQIPVGRLGLPQDIANVVLFLSSEETAYITGQVIPVTGGWMV